MESGPLITWDFVSVFNACEAVWWMAIGIGVCYATATRPTSVARVGRFIAAMFVLFGASDVIEVFTGAWWRPWLLAVMKGSCVLAIACGAWRLWRLTHPLQCPRDP